MKKLIIGICLICLLTGCLYGDSVCKQFCIDQGADTGREHEFFNDGNLNEMTCGCIYRISPEETNIWQNKTIGED